MDASRRLSRLLAPLAIVIAVAAPAGAQSGVNPFRMRVGPR
jgi:hypothetical protein